MVNTILKIFLKLILRIILPVELWYYQFSKLVSEEKSNPIQVPVLLLFAALGLDNGLSGSQTMARRMLPHVLGAMSDVSTVRHSAQHHRAEMKTNVTVKHLVVLGGVHAQ